MTLVEKIHFAFVHSLDPASYIASGAMEKQGHYLRQAQKQKSKTLIVRLKKTVFVGAKWTGQPPPITPGLLNISNSSETAM